MICCMLMSHGSVKLLSMACTAEIISTVANAQDAFFFFSKTPAVTLALSCEYERHFRLVLESVL